MATLSIGCVPIGWLSVVTLTACAFAAVAQQPIIAATQIIRSILASKLHVPPGFRRQKFIKTMAPGTGNPRNAQATLTHFQPVHQSIAVSRE
jgi:hypothetical protein